MQLTGMVMKSYCINRYTSLQNDAVILASMLRVCRIDTRVGKGKIEMSRNVLTKCKWLVQKGTLDRDSRWKTIIHCF